MTEPPLVVNLRAFETRFNNTYWILYLSETIVKLFFEANFELLFAYKDSKFSKKHCSETPIYSALNIYTSKISLIASSTLNF